MFKSAPKAQVEAKFVELFGRTKVAEVNGSRVMLPNGYHDTFVSTVTVDGLVIASAQNPNWRRSYMQLKLEVVKLYSSIV
jgi:hypothetical protein